MIATLLGANADPLPPGAFAWLGYDPGQIRNDGDTLRVALSPDGTRAAVALKGENVLLLDVAARHPLLRFEDCVFSGGLDTLEFSPDGRFLITRPEKSLVLHDVKTGSGAIP